jgi:hypothetical protein
MVEEDSVEETNSGVKKKGSWKEIAEFGEDVRDAIDGSAGEDSIDKFEDWRPRVEESERDVKKKTVDKAVLDRKELERESDGAASDLKQASGKVTEAGRKAAKRKNPEEEIKGASKDAAKPFYSKFAKLFRGIESFVYSNIVLKLNPYYLDTEDFSADIKHRSRGEFEMDISVPKEEEREELKDSFRQGSEERDLDE